MRSLDRTDSSFQPRIIISRRGLNASRSGVYGPEVSKRGSVVNISVIIDLFQASGWFMEHLAPGGSGAAYV